MLVANRFRCYIFSLKALDVGAGDEVIVPSNTATAMAIIECVATPLFDIFRRASRTQNKTGFLNRYLYNNKFLLFT